MIALTGNFDIFAPRLTARLAAVLLVARNITATWDVRAFLVLLVSHGNSFGRYCSEFSTLRQAPARRADMFISQNRPMRLLRSLSSAVSWLTARSRGCAFQHSPVCARYLPQQMAHDETCCPVSYPRFEECWRIAPPRTFRIFDNWLIVTRQAFQNVKSNELEGTAQSVVNCAPIHRVFRRLKALK